MVLGSSLDASLSTLTNNILFENVYRSTPWEVLPHRTQIDRLINHMSLCSFTYLYSYLAWF